MVPIALAALVIFVALRCLQEDIIASASKTIRTGVIRDISQPSTGGHTDSNAARVGLTDLPPTQALLAHPSSRHQSANQWDPWEGVRAAAVSLDARPG